MSGASTGSAASTTPREPSPNPTPRSVGTSSAAAALSAPPRRASNSSSLPTSVASSPVTSPSWPHPDAVSVSTFHARGLSSSSPSKRPLLTSLPSPRATRFEVALVDRLADCLESDLDGIWEASGAVKVELVGAKGQRRFIASGSSSAITKARQLVDAKLSQTPIRILLAVRYLHSDLSTLELVPSPTPSIRSASFPSPPLYRAKECAPSSISPATLSAALAPHANQQPNSPFSPPLSDVLTPGATTDSSESSSGFFTAQSRSLSRHSLLGDTSVGLPSIGSFGFHREGYVEAVVDELETCVERRSLVRLKLAAGTQHFMPPEGEKELKLAMGRRWGVEDVEKWKIDGPEKTLGTFFSLALSAERAEEFRRVLVDQMGLELSHGTSHVHVQHLDRRRAVFGVATAELRGSEIKGLQPGVSASGTLNLKKVSTLPSKPFFLSITSPVQEDEPMREGTDLRIKVLSDKAATSPSMELSQSFNSASWDLDAAGRFEVHLTLDPERFSESVTDIRYMAKSRYENERFRATLIEIRLHGSSSHWYEVEFASRVLNTTLARSAQARETLKREAIREMVEELVGFCEEVVGAGEGGTPREREE